MSITKMYAYSTKLYKLDPHQIEPSFDAAFRSGVITYPKAKNLFITEVEFRTIGQFIDEMQICILLDGIRECAEGDCTKEQVGDWLLPNDDDPEAVTRSNLHTQELVVAIREALENWASEYGYQPLFMCAVSEPVMSFRRQIEDELKRYEESIAAIETVIDPEDYYR